MKVVKAFGWCLKLLKGSIIYLIYLIRTLAQNRSWAYAKRAESSFFLCCREDFHHTSLWVYDSSSARLSKSSRTSPRTSRRAPFLLLIKENFENVEYKQVGKQNALFSYPIGRLPSHGSPRGRHGSEEPKNKCSVTERKQKSKSICNKQHDSFPNPNE